MVIDLARAARLLTFATFATFAAGCSGSGRGASSGSDAGGNDATAASDGSSVGDDAQGPVVSEGGADGGAAQDSGVGADGAPGSDAATPTCITPATPQTCSAPEQTALPICTLSQTGCMDPSNPTQFAARAVYYEVNSPLWSDGAAKSRAFVLPTGGTIHVKNCEPDAGTAALAECVSPGGVPSGPADTGKWVFPVGTVMIKNFGFAGKLVETRLLMHVDAATAALVGNGTDWVGYNYAWNEAQTEATIVPNERLSVTFDAGSETVVWNYPNFLDCAGCHGAAVGTIGPENDQMNREVDGGNQIDSFIARGLFDTTAPTKPYPAPMVEPYANASLGLTGPPAGTTVEAEARSYLAANCSFCHRPDVNDLGFDFRYGLTFAQVGICGLAEQNSLPGMPNQQYLDFAPGDHASSAMWLRMNTGVPSSDPGEMFDVGRMPPLASFDVDTQAVTLIGSWIDSVATCP